MYKQYFRKILILIFFSTVVYLGTDYYLEFLGRVADQDFVTISFGLFNAVKIFSTLFIVSIFLIKVPKAKSFFQEYSSYINTLLVLVTILITFSVYLISEYNRFYLTNTGLLVNNKLNILIAEDMKGNPPIVQKFYVDVYQENIAFISKNFTNDTCAQGYFSLMLTMTKFNYELDLKTAINISEVDAILERAKFLSVECHNSKPLWPSDLN